MRRLKQVRDLSASGTGRIRLLRADLSPAEQLACDEVLALAGDPMSLAIAVIARAANVSEATVTRMCRHLGFPSFSALRMALVAEAARNATQMLPGGSAGESVPARALRHTAAAYAAAIHETAATVPAETIAEIGRLLRAASRISVLGIGGSAAVAADLCHKLGKLGLAASAQGDGDMMTIAASAARPGHVLIGISHTGRTESVVAALALGRSRGASVIAVTHDPNAPIARVADLLVRTASRATDLPTDELSGRMAQLLIFDAVYTVLALDDLGEGRSRLTDVTEAFDRQRLR
ncbi:MurR/RpiR family transcriptional regulator [Acidisoma cellulosilytica]|uniref:MurR/RpiR family transcriptional regulator n=1 Tax=Acidisoma cellulosilyticum TaxID=2802395 RepID=A0A964E5B3_9PROT|nr:MurR/RpiR family transcriptional regulator [Acidisoma cellulosilyticum]MCB8882361.1 MurR/RpiR family transcriptional regulator [Acidisoma cellulosilyticum]